MSILNSDLQRDIVDCPIQVTEYGNLLTTNFQLSHLLLCQILPLQRNTGPSDFEVYFILWDFEVYVMGVFMYSQAGLPL